MGLSVELDFDVRVERDQGGLRKGSFNKCCTTMPISGSQERAPNIRLHNLWFDGGFDDVTA